MGVFSFGEQLYRPTLRDEQTLLIEPFARLINITIPIGPSTVNQLLVPPLDRCLFIESLVIVGIPGVADTIIGFDVNQGDPVFGSQPLRVFEVFDGNGLIGTNASSVSGPGKEIVISLPNFNHLFPPRSSVGFDVNRDNAAVISTVQINLYGYLLPPGGMGRAT